MSEAAKLLGLDPEDERHRTLLLECVRAAGKRRGRPKGSVRWDFEKLLELGRAAQCNWTAHFDGRRPAVVYKSDTELAEQIFESQKGYFQSAEAVRRLLPTARKAAELWDEIGKGHHPCPVQIRLNLPPPGTPEEEAILRVLFPDDPADGHDWLWYLERPEAK
jgi:hypothetical protein